MNHVMHILLSTNGSEGERDYATIRPGIPARKGNHELGHSEAFNAPNAGIAGLAGRHLMPWLLRGDVKSKLWFTDGGVI